MGLRGLSAAAKQINNRAGGASIWDTGGGNILDPHLLLKQFAVTTRGPEHVLHSLPLLCPCVCSVAMAFVKVESTAPVREMLAHLTDPRTTAVNSKTPTFASRCLNVHIESTFCCSTACACKRVQAQCPVYSPFRRRTFLLRWCAVLCQENFPNHLLLFYISLTREFL